MWAELLSSLILVTHEQIQTGGFAPCLRSRHRQPRRLGRGNFISLHSTRPQDLDGIAFQFLNAKCHGNWFLTPIIAAAQSRRQICQSCYFLPRSTRLNWRWGHKQKPLGSSVILFVWYIQANSPLGNPCAPEYRNWDFLIKPSHKNPPLLRELYIIYMSLFPTLLILPLYI